MAKQVFYEAKILLPQQSSDNRWPVMACDQFTSQPAYWQETQSIVGNAPSTLNLVLPEVYLDQPDTPAKIDAIHTTMQNYYAGGVFQPPLHGYVYVERTMQNGTVRQGLVGCVDLEDYSYVAGEQQAIRPSEGTVLERIPPRLAVRRGALLESPHILMLMDDDENAALGYLAAKKAELQPLYNLTLMQGGGKLCGWAVTQPKDIVQIQEALSALQDAKRFEMRYQTKQKPFVFVVGDGNHSLATAKANWEEEKLRLPVEQQAEHPARFCLVELGNIQSSANAIEPIHRVLFGVNTAEFLQQAQQYAQKQGSRLAQQAGQAGQQFIAVWQGKPTTFVLENPTKALAVASLEAFLEEYLLANSGCRVDYVHGEAAVLGLSMGNNLGIILPPLAKSDLFLGVAQGGVLPRKTFSMGHAEEKRYYYECRKIIK